MKQPIVAPLEAKPLASTRIAVSGLGTITAAGPGLGQLEAALRACRPLFGPVRRFSAAGHAVDLAAEVSLDDAELSAGVEDRLGKKLPGPCSRSDLLALWAAAEALEDAEAGQDPERRKQARHGTMVVLGGSVGGMGSTERWLASLGLAPGSAWPTPPADIDELHPVSTSAHQVASCLGLGGGTLTLNTACSSSANALLLGATLIRQGMATRVLAGGVDALCQLTYAGFGSLGLLDPAGCRPFDASRRGLTLGEGAAFAVLEREADAVRVVGLLLGGASGAEGHHPTAPEPGGERAAEVIGRALADAGVEPTAVDYVNAHGTGTPQNDLAESKALRAALGDHGSRVPVSSSKSILGHTLAAAGAVEAAVSWLGLRHGFLPPGAGLAQPDPACQLDLVTAARPARLRTALSTSFGFGGNLVALVLGAPPEGHATP